MTTRYVPVVVNFHNGPLDGKSSTRSETATVLIVREFPGGRYVHDSTALEWDADGRPSGDWWWIPAEQPT